MNHFIGVVERNNICRTLPHRRLGHAEILLQRHQSRRGQVRNLVQIERNGNGASYVYSVFYGQHLSNREFFVALLKKNIKVTIFFGVIATLIFLAVKWNWYVGTILFLPYVILGVVSFGQSVSTFYSGVSATVTYFFIRRHSTSEERGNLIEGVSPSDQKYVLSSAICQLAAGLFFLAFVVWILGAIIDWW